MTNDSAVAVIGAGPAGLAISALLSRQNISHTVYDNNSTAGGLYSRLNSELGLLSPAYFNSLPLIKYRDNTGHNTVSDYARYLREYVEANNPPLQLNTRITEIIKENQTYRLISEGSEHGKSMLYKQVVVATGMSSFARPLDIDVASSIEIQNALQFKGIEYYRGKNILIVGSGTSAFEMASLLADTTNIWLATNKPVKSTPLTFFGINIHFFVRPLERIPITRFPKLCQSGFQEKTISQNIHKLIEEQRIKIVKPPKQVTDDHVVFSDGISQKIDIIINCSGYQFNTDILPTDVRRHPNGNIMTRRCQSISHPGLYMIGHPCTGGLDSKFLRGIYHDAYRILRQIY